MSLKTTPTPDPAAASRPPFDATPLEALFKGRRGATAAALLVLLEIVPLAGLTVALREGVGIWIVFTVMLLCDALGAFGRGWLAKAKRTTPDQTLTLEYDRIVRASTPASSAMT